MVRLLTVPEVAERLHMSKWSVYELVRAKRLPVVRLTPGKLLFAEDKLEEAICRAAVPSSESGSGSGPTAEENARERQWAKADPPATSGDHRTCRETDACRGGLQGRNLSSNLVDAKGEAMTKKRAVTKDRPQPTLLRLEWIDPAELEANPSNWRRHPLGQTTALADVISEVGWAGALLYNERTKRLIDGHARKELFAGKDKVPVLVGSWDESQEKKILATLDPLSAMAEADAGRLDALLREVQTDSEALRGMLTALAAGELTQFLEPDLTKGLTDPDEVPEPPDEPITRPGDLWVLGNHRLLCGDSSQPEDVDRLLAGAPIHLVNTDPPYNVRVEPRSNNAIAAGLSSFPQYSSLDTARDLCRHPEKAAPTTRKLRAKDRPLANDFVSDTEFHRLLHAWFGNIARVLQVGRAFYLWGGFSNVGNYPSALKECGLYFSQAIIWVKEHPVLTRKDFMGNHEWCFYGWREGAAHQFFGPNNAVDVWSVKKINPQSMIHLTEKPVELAVRAIHYSSRADEHVLDLFGGSGSTLIAAEQTGRRAFLLEIDPPYCDVIVQRWENFTGSKAERQEAAC